MGFQTSRRSFLKAAASTGAVLTIGVTADGVVAAGRVADQDFNPFVRIDSKGMVTIVLKHFEMGQGTTTGLATLAAEELDADWAQVRFDFAPADTKTYANLMFGAQGTGGSTAMANSYMQYRQAGAVARDMLVRAAAARWKVSPDSVTVSKGVVRAGSHKAGFGELVADAARLSPVAEPRVKTPDQFTLIGTDHLPRKDSRDKTDGSGVFAMDVHLPGMVYAVILRAPRFGGTVTGFDSSAASRLPGFVAAQTLPNKAGVAVFGKSTWAALQARDALKVQWDFSAAENRSSDQIAADLRKDALAAALPVHNADARPAISAAIDGAAKKIEAEFHFPFLAHAPMEPLNCVIAPKADGGVLVHDGCQFPTITQPTVAAVLGLKPEQVEIRTLYAGGSFGRRANPTSDYHAEAAMAFALMGGKVPVKLVWTREDDIKGGYYRSPACHVARIGLDAQGNLVGWDHRVAVKSIIKGTLFEQAMVHGGVDHTSVEGVLDNPYAIPAMSIGLTDFQTPVPVLWWRSVGHTHTGFVMESLVDMVAHESGRDPIDLRLSLLNQAAPDARQARMIGAIKAARDMSGWGQPAPAGRVRGFAAHYSFNTFVAVVAEVTVKDDKVHVDRLFMAVDCGVAINPDVIKAQMEGGAGYALSAVLKNAVTLHQGEVEQSNFPDYEPLRLTEMPEIVVRIVPSAQAPTGVGEPGVPPVGPAVFNAVFAATGKRVTTLPLTSAGFTIV